MEWEWEALRHYEKLVTAAASLCAPGGMLFVASCTFSIGLPAPFSFVDRPKSVEVGFQYVSRRANKRGLMWLQVVQMFAPSHCRVLSRV